MTDNRTTELLDGLRHVGNLHEFAELFGFDWYDEGDWWTWHDVAVKMADDMEQAMVSTLGVGTLTAEQVREAIMSADRWEKPMGDTGLTNTHLIIRDDGWQAIADELNARTERTCEITYKRGAMYDVGRYSCCGYELATPVSESMPAENYCPNCGAKVVGE